MNNLREQFLKYICQTSASPIGLEIVRAEGCTLYDRNNNEYLDCISGIAVANVGHNHPAVRSAIHAQVNKYSHVMVYGEYLLEPQIAYARALADAAPDKLSVTYFTNSGAEAVEGALKTAKKYTGRPNIVAFENSYHGDTMGALSVMGSVIYRKPFEPLLPGITFFPFNTPQILDAINSTTAAVIVEPVQGEAGVIIPTLEFLKKLRERCTAMGTVLIFDEVQTGFGRTGRMFAGEHWNVVPDIMVMAKAMGGGLPLGGFIGTHEIMNTLSHDPPFAHVTTFGGNPVCCAAGLAALEVIQNEHLVEKSDESGQWLLENLRLIPSNGKIREVRGIGLMMAIEFSTPAFAAICIRKAFEQKIILGGLLQAPAAVRIAPPLIISKEECERLIKDINEIVIKL